MSKDCYIPASERYNKPPPPEVQAKLDRSEQEVEGLTERIIKCPYCDFHVDTIFSDLVGHYRRSCRKCKKSFIVNPAYFRRLKRRETLQYRHRYERNHAYRKRYYES